MNNDKKRWVFSFDLDTKKLEKEYASKWYTEGYGKISDYLFSHGFDADAKKQGSVYFTEEYITHRKAINVVTEMFKELPWLAECMRMCSLDEVREPDMSIMEFLDRFKKSPEHKMQLEQYRRENGWYDEPTEEITRGKSR